MRGVLKHYGSLPHLSGVGDVRTAEVLVQAAYLASSDDPSEGAPPDRERRLAEHVADDGRERFAGKR